MSGAGVVWPWPGEAQGDGNGTPSEPENKPISEPEKKLGTSEPEKQQTPNPESRHQVRQSFIAAGREDLVKTLVDFSTPPELREGRADLTLVHDEAKGFKDKVERIKAARIPGPPRQLCPPLHPIN